MHSAALWLGLSGLVIIAVLMQRKIKARRILTDPDSMPPTVMLVAVPHAAGLPASGFVVCTINHDTKSPWLKSLQLTFWAHTALLDTRG